IVARDAVRRLLSEVTGQLIARHVAAVEALDPLYPPGPPQRARGTPSWSSTTDGSSRLVWLPTGRSPGSSPPVASPS
ncbi:MAG: hypothetical protein V3T72_00105, partial [Thermoanaerobaculia bacterium]